VKVTAEDSDAGLQITETEYATLTLPSSLNNDIQFSNLASFVRR
jgi:hypothetical protein